MSVVFGQCISENPSDNETLRHASITWSNKIVPRMTPSDPNDRGDNQQQRLPALAVELQGEALLS